MPLNDFDQEFQQHKEETSARGTQSRETSMGTTLATPTVTTPWDRAVAQGQQQERARLLAEQAAANHAQVQHELTMLRASNFASRHSTMLIGVLAGVLGGILLHAWIASPAPQRHRVRR